MGLLNLVDFSFADISAAQVDSLWKACAWEFALTNQSSHWCSLFTNEDFFVFEYREDLKFFYESGYGGSSLGYDIACPLLKNMIDLFDAKISGDDKVKFERARLRFGHAETIVPFLVMMVREPCQPKFNTFNLTLPYLGNI